LLLLLIIIIIIIIIMAIKSSLDPGRFQGIFPFTPVQRPSGRCPLGPSAAVLFRFSTFKKYRMRMSPSSPTLDLLEGHRYSVRV
jgi:hypothetical protein